MALCCIAAVRVAGPLNIWWDKAPSHAASHTKAAELFAKVIEQPGNSPDMNTKDAAIFPYLERSQQKSGARTKEEIRASVHACWAALPDKTLVRAANRVRKNLKEIIRKKGGNYYRQHARPDPDNIDQECEICEATYERGATEESRMLLCEDCGDGYHVRCLGKKRVPRGEFKCHACTE